MNFPTKAPSSLRRPWLALLAMAAAIPSLGAGIGFRLSQNDGGGGTGITSVETYVDWSHTTTVLNHSNHGMWTNPNGSSTKYADYQIFGDPAPATSKCFEMSTSQASANLVADPIIWIKSGTGSGVWTKLADDVQGTLPYARIWVPAGLFTNAWSKIRLAAYSSNHNSNAFRFTSNWSSSEMGTCAGGTTPAAVISTNGMVTIVRAQ